MVQGVRSLIRELAATGWLGRFRSSSVLREIREQAPHGFANCRDGPEVYAASPTIGPINCYRRNRRRGSEIVLRYSWARLGYEIPQSHSAIRTGALASWALRLAARLGSPAAEPAPGSFRIPSIFVAQRAGPRTIAVRIDRLVEAMPSRRAPRSIRRRALSVNAVRGLSSSLSKRYSDSGHTIVTLVTTVRPQSFGKCDSSHIYCGA